MHPDEKQLMELPISLRPWVDYLGWIKPELTYDLATMTQRMARVMASFFRASYAGHTIPDGYAGIARKGKPEHLLISEWLLSEEMPDEFMRRAVMNEQLYLQTQRQDPRTPVWISLICDVGPLQWGTPRLIHLATMIILARRAAELGAGFRWGMLHAPHQSWIAGLDHESIRVWHTAAAVADNDDERFLSLWQEKTENENISETGDTCHTETWIIGSPALEAHIDTTSSWGLITCCEPLDPAENNTLHLTITHHAAKQSHTLPLPDSTTCVQLLRNPLRPFRKTTSPLDTVDSLSWKHCFLRFSPHGRGLILRYPLESLRFFSFSKRKLSFSNDRQLARPSFPIMGGGIANQKQITFLQQGETALHLICPGKWLFRISRYEIIDSLSSETELRSSHPVLLKGHWHECMMAGGVGYILDAFRQLWCIAGDNTLNCLARNVLYLSVKSSTLNFLQGRNDGFSWQYHDHIHRNILFLTLPLLVPRIHTAPGPTFIQENEGTLQALAWSDHDNNWIVATAHGYQMIGPIDGKDRIVALVSGIVEMWGQAIDSEPGAIVYCHDGSLIHLSPTKRTVLRHFDRHPLTIAFDIANERAAWVDETRTLTVESWTNITDAAPLSLSLDGSLEARQT